MDLYNWVAGKLEGDRSVGALGALGGGGGTLIMGVVYQLSA